MRAREEFNNLMPPINEEWVARVLGLERQPTGVDVVGEKCIVEVKFSLPEYINWTVLEREMSYPNQHPGKTAYWGLGIYHFSKTVNETVMGENLEKLVSKRELWLIPWQWMEQFPPSQTQYNVLRYPKFRLFPETTETCKIPKGKIHLTAGVDKKDFPLLS